MHIGADPKRARLRRRNRAFTVHRNEGASVTTLELFFDLVFVLAITQCTALMAHTPTWTGIARGFVVIAMMWWAWTGYAWLTSVINPELLTVRIPLLVAMAAVLVAALCVPSAFGQLGLLFVSGYAMVRLAHILLFWLASTGDAGLRESVGGFAATTCIAVALLFVGATALHGWARWALWAATVAFDCAGPSITSVRGWQLVPGHFAERHGDFLIIALGESIVAIGVAAEHRVTAGTVVAATLGMAIAGAVWWVYFDVLALVAEHRLRQAKAGYTRNAMARDAYSYLHLPMIAGIVLFAFGLKTTLEDIGSPLALVPACALFGGIALYLAGLLTFAMRTTHRFQWDAPITAAAACACIPVARHLNAELSLLILTILVLILVAYKVQRYGEGRRRVRTHVVHPNM